MNKQYDCNIILDLLPLSIENMVTEETQKEIDRLEHTSKTYGDKRKTLLRDEKKKFQYPAYIAVENAAHQYEYALLTGENQITYICTCYINKEDVKFSEDYLPYARDKRCAYKGNRI